MNISSYSNKTVEQLEQIAKEGNAHAQYTLGVMYEYGHGVSQDENEALKWYRLSADSYAKRNS